MMICIDKNAILLPLLSSAELSMASLSSKSNMLSSEHDFLVIRSLVMYNRAIGFTVLSFIL